MLRRHLDVTKITQDLLRFLAKQTGDRLLRNLLRPDNKGELAQWCWGRQAADAVAEHPVWADAQEWSDVLGRLQNRRYSISSSPHTDPATLSLTVSVVRYDGSQGRKRKGVCSGFLADAEPGAEVDVYVVPSPRFHPPADPSTPMVMVGPGTGVAPFIGFLHDRAARGHTGANWLFFGEQHQATDYYYREEVEAFQREGTLTRLDTAFSRDQRAKVYVQDRMREHEPTASGSGWNPARTSTSAATPPGWRETWTRPCAPSSQRTATCPPKPPTPTSSASQPRSATCATCTDCAPIAYWPCTKSSYSIVLRTGRQDLSRRGRRCEREEPQDNLHRGTLSPRERPARPGRTRSPHSRSTANATTSDGCICAGRSL